MKLYVDGVLDIERPYTGTLTAYTSPGDEFYFGAGNLVDLLRNSLMEI